MSQDQPRTRKIIVSNDEARLKVLHGTKQLSEAVGVTLGPKGRPVMLGRTYWAPNLTKDGVTVAREYFHDDPVSNVAAWAVKDVAAKTNRAAGDGTTTATILAASIYEMGVKLLYGTELPAETVFGRFIQHIESFSRNLTPKERVDHRDLREGIKYAVAFVTEYIKQQSRPVTIKSADLHNVCMVSSNGDKELADMVSKAAADVGKDGVVNIEEGTGERSSVKIHDGLHYNRGWTSWYYNTDIDRMVCEYNDVDILVTTYDIMDIDDILPIIKRAAEQKRPLMIISQSMKTQPAAILVQNRQKNNLKVVSVNAPGWGNYRNAMLDDIATYTGATLITDEKNLGWKDVDPSFLGRAEKIIVDQENTTIIGGKGNSKDVVDRIKLIEKQMDGMSNQTEKENCKKRIAKLRGQIAVIKIGGSTELEVKERRDRAEDAVYAAKAAIEEGVVPGGGTVYYRASLELAKKTINGSSSFRKGVMLIQEVLKVPLHTILRNAGLDPKKDLDANIIASGRYKGYDAQDEVYVDMMEKGIMDPTKVLRCALEYAESIASQLLSNSVIIVDRPQNLEKEFETKEDTANIGFRTK